MNDEYLIQDVLAAIRVNDTYESRTEVSGLIAAAIADLKRQGVSTINLDDPLTVQAVKLYCKGHYGYDADSGKFLHCYEALSAAMALDIMDYRSGTTT